MSDNKKDIDACIANLKNESARQRWQMFHRAISFAKQSNDEALGEPDVSSAEADCSRPILSIVR